MRARAQKLYDTSEGCHMDTGSRPLETEVSEGSVPKESALLLRWKAGHWLEQGVLD